MCDSVEMLKKVFPNGSVKEVGDHTGKVVVDEVTLDHMIQIVDIFRKEVNLIHKVNVKRSGTSVTVIAEDIF